MALSDKQKKVIEFCLSNNNTISKKQAMGLINTHYCNGEKHVGEVLSRMVKQGLLVRIKPGHFQLGKGTKNKPSTIDNNQVNLF